MKRISIAIVLVFLLILPAFPKAVSSKENAPSETTSSLFAESMGFVVPEEKSANFQTGILYQTLDFDVLTLGKTIALEAGSEYGDDHIFCFMYMLYIITHKGGKNE